jgi:hypothetical protein
MLDYQIDALPHRPIVRLEQIEHARVEALAAQLTPRLLSQGYNPKDPEQVKKHHLFGDGTKPPRLVMQLVASDAIKELELTGSPPIRDLRRIAEWVTKLPDDALLPLFRECVIRSN